ncbi:hypothetical protein CA13_07330 [Planctomycetes bacterium CA13]|uniref:Secreted protein n=1 Tax=Novipirellula herctigrandis TaxID=2527986 RepID=A0A5C5YWC6_9BACT|nr:hypothetical protein CA13_07330 [Planctomycetes bacterium CA13]
MKIRNSLFCWMFSASLVAFVTVNAAAQTTPKPTAPLPSQRLLPTQAELTEMMDEDEDEEKPAETHKALENEPAVENQTSAEKKPTVEEALRDAFLPPPHARPLRKDSFLWVDRDKKRVYIDGYLAMDRGPLEMFACPRGTKEHESIVATIARSSEVHAALLAVGTMPGTPVRFDPEFLPPTGQRVRVWVSWRDEKGKYHVSDARRWVKESESGKQMQPDWVFAGSGFWTDPSDNKQYYRADGGDMICVSNFSSAMLDIGAASSASADSLLYTPFTGRIPPRHTLVRLTLVPIPIPTDKPKHEDAIDPDKPPGDEILPVKK